MFDSIKIFESVTDIPTSLKADFIRVFDKAFGSKNSKAKNISRKYFSEKGLRSGAFICVGYYNNQASAFYCTRLVDTNCNERIVISMDTMSDGKIKNSIVQLTNHFYPFLLSRGIKILLAWPNMNIIGLRIQKLGWNYVGSYQLRIRYKFSKDKPILTWSLPRDGLFWRFDNMLNSITFDIFKKKYFPFQLNLVLRNDINFGNISKFRKRRTIKHLCVKYLDKSVYNKFSTDIIPTLPFEAIDVP